jgi:dihydrofolate reductase
MAKVRVSGFTLSIDGFGAGPQQSRVNPLGIGGEALHEWMISTRFFQHTLLGNDQGTTGIDNEFADRGMANIGAWIMGRNMFGPVRGEWPDGMWKGWWGDNPPYHTDVFVLTNHERAPLMMEGGTVFHFVTDGIHVALERAKASAGDRDIRIGGGVSAIRQYLEAGLVDEMHLAVSPALLGSGEHLLGAIDLPALGFDRIDYTPTPAAAHYFLTKQ